MNCRKLILLSLALFLSFKINAQKPTVVSSASMIWDMVKNVGGDNIEHGLIVPIGGDPHIYEPTPRDAQLVTSADHIFVNGLTFEGWVLELIENSGTKASVDTVTNGINPITSSVYKDSFDPHAWMDISNAIIYVDNIKNALIQLDPDNKENYLSNHAAYVGKLKPLDDYIFNRIKEIPEDQRILITSHDAFQYYGNRYGLRLEAIMGISTEAEAQTSDMIRITDAIKSTGVPAIFIESTINPKLIQQIASDNNVSIGGELFADSIGDENSHAPSYYDMLKHNTDTIVNALSKPKSETPELSSNKSGNYLPYLTIGLFLIAALLIIIKRMNK